MDGDSIKLRVYWDQAKKGSTSNGNRNRRPSLSGGHGRSNYNPLQQAMRQAKNVKIVHEHHDYDVGYFPDTGVHGKVRSSSADSPATKTAATPMDLTPGTIVQALLIRDKSIPLKDLKETDLKVKSLTAMGQNPNYKGDTATANNAKKKK